MEVDSVRNYGGVSPVAQSYARNAAGSAANTAARVEDAVTKVTDAGSGVQGIQAGLEAAMLKAKIQAREEKAENLTVQEREASGNLLKMAVESANTKLVPMHRMLNVSIHDKTRRIMVKVIDTETDEVIREIPPEKTLDMFAKILELAGILYDEKK